MPAANLYERSITDTDGSYQPLADAPLVMDATLIASPSNTGNVSVRFLGMSGNPLEIMTADWPSGSEIHLRNVDLSQITVNVPAEHAFVVIAQAP